jgi:uncharacterized cupin superfamily protein
MGNKYVVRVGDCIYGEVGWQNRWFVEPSVQKDGETLVTQSEGCCAFGTN